MSNANFTFSFQKLAAEVMAFYERKETGRETKVLKTGNVIYYPCSEEGRRKWLTPSNAFGEIIK